MPQFALQLYAEFAHLANGRNQLGEATLGKGSNPAAESERRSIGSAGPPEAVGLQLADSAPAAESPPAPKGTASLTENGAEDEPPSAGIRESMGRLPEYLQPMLTWITGRPRWGETAWRPMTPVQSLAVALLWLGTGVAGSVAVVHAGPTLWPLLLITWAATVYGARALQVEITHACVHGQFSASQAKAAWLAEIVTAALMVQNFVEYLIDHLVHHGTDLATSEDADGKFLLSLGFRPGMTKQALWKHLVQTLFSPRFHFWFLRARVAANFVTPPLRRKVLAGILLFAPVLTAAALDSIWIWLAAWAFPMTMLLHSSALLQFASEHRWFLYVDKAHPGRLRVGRLTVGRFMGEAAPPPGLSPLKFLPAWGGWVARMLLIHLPSRVFVVVAGLPAHDWHHRKPKSASWPNAMFARQRDLEAGCPGWPEPYAEVWGLIPAIDEVFEVLSKLPPLPEAEARMPTSVLGEGLMAM